MSLGLNIGRYRYNWSNYVFKQVNYLIVKLQGNDMAITFKGYSEKVLEKLEILMW